MIFQRLKAQSLSLLFFAFAMGGCISVNLAPKVLEPAEKLSFEAPKSPFQEIASGSADKAWRNPQTGNTITYVSECGDHGRIVLKDIAKTLLNSQGLAVQSQKKITYKGVEAIESIGQQKSRDAAVKVELLTFFKNNCLFNLAYLGSESAFAKDHSAYLSFKKDFNPL